MSLRPKTVRRLSVLLAGVLVLVAIGAGLYLSNERRKEARLTAARKAGMVAFESGDYRAALESLKTYVARRRGDSEALYAYGLSRARIEEPNGKHVTEGIGVFIVLLQNDPGHRAAKHELLDLYAKAFYNHELLELADKLLRENPDDERALRYKAVALDRLRRHEEALAVSERLNELHPTDLEQQLATYRRMHALKRPASEMVARAHKHLTEHPGDPRFELLAAWVHGTTGDAERGTALLRQAASRPAPDATYVRYAIRVLDSLSMYREAQEVLDRAAEQKRDPEILAILAQRLWQSGRHEQVLERLEDVARPDPDVLAYRAMALNDLGRRDEAARVVAELAQRTGDSEAIGWATALSAHLRKLDPKLAVEQYRAALDRSPENPVVRYLLGEAYARLGENELALQSWRRAAELAPSWGTPHVETARTLLTIGRIKDAVRAAQQASSAAPELLAARTTLAIAQHKALLESELAPEHEPALLALVHKIQQSQPGEPETVPIYVDLLARAAKKNEAIAVVRGAIADPARRAAQPTILRLIAASRAHELGLEEELQRAISGSPIEDNPRVALARAADLAANGRPQDGLALIETGARGATTQPVQWQLALVQYKELIHDRSAAAQWVRLGEAHPQNLEVQTAILKTGHSARSDRDFIARTIERMKELTGTEGQTWKIERARWLVSSDSSKDAAEAVNTLSEIVRASPTLPLLDARQLLASAYEKVGNLPAATKEMQAAAELAPADLITALEVARLLQAQNRFDEARLYLDRALASPDLTPPARRRAAGLLANQGDVAQAIQVLRDGNQVLDEAGQLLLAELHRREDRPAAADEIYARLLSRQPLSIDVVRATADFYASQGRLDQAKQVLSRMKETHPPAGVTELARAAFEERYGTPAAALRNYTAATEAAANDPVTWRQLVAFHLRSGRYDEAQKVADDGVRATGGGRGGANTEGDRMLLRLRTASGTLSQLAGKQPQWRAALATLAAAALDDRGALELLTTWELTTASSTTSGGGVAGVVAAGGAGNQASAGAAVVSTISHPAGSGDVQPTSQPAAASQTLHARLKDFIERHPRSLPLRHALIQWYASARQLEEAARVATETMDAFPADPDSARIAAIVYRGARKYDLAAAAATRWRERSAVDPMPADRALAEIKLASGDAAGAVKALQPYAKELIDHPDAHPTTLATLLRAYVLTGREEEVRTTLQPLLGKDARWRAIWLQLAGNDVKDPGLAAEWIRQLAPQIAPTNPVEQTALATAWYQISIRTRDPGANAEGAKVLDPIVKQPTAPGTAVLLRGGIAHRAGDLVLAEELYRRGLTLLPDQPEPMNNLAYLIFVRGGDLAEAKSLALRAIQLSPESPGFYDTLARIQTKMGEREAAVETFQTALRLEPNHLEALIGLATAFWDAGKREAALTLLPQIDTLANARPALPASLRRELEALREMVKPAL